ncbi:MAG: ATPase domain-containing protein, partial [bacterium]
AQSIDANDESSDNPFGFSNSGGSGVGSDGNNEVEFGGEDNTPSPSSPEDFDDEDFDSDLDRIDLGINGLDEMILGGVPQQSLIGIIGGAGTGKTTFGLQFLNEALENGERTVFITLEQTEEAILSTAEEKGWSFREYHYIRKCQLCYDNRLAKGKQPACTEACTKEATVFGERDELLKEAKKRIKNNPDRYLPKVYGEKVVGGTGVMYLSDVSLDFLGWSKELPEKPLPEHTWKVLKKVPYEFFGVGAIMAGIYWITGRRAKVAEAEEAKQSSQAEPAGKEEESSAEESAADTGDKE